MQTANFKLSHTNKLFLPYDIYERHRQIGSLIKNSQSVLDVGGELNQLSQFCKPDKIIVANLQSSMEKSDIAIGKDKLPFSKDSFDVVTAIDVLEHIPKNKRSNFIWQILEVAKDKMILSFPISSEKHNTYEKEIEGWLVSKQKDVTYLKEHIKFGLPTPSEINELTKGLKCRIFYSGNINLNKYLFKLYLFDPNIKFIRKFIYFLKLFFNFLTNSLFYYFLTNKKLTNNVNRAYLIINKGR